MASWSEPILISSEEEEEEVKPIVISNVEEEEEEEDLIVISDIEEEEEDEEEEEEEEEAAIVISDVEEEEEEEQEQAIVISDVEENTPPLGTNVPHLPSSDVDTSNIFYKGYRQVWKEECFLPWYKTFYGVAHQAAKEPHCSGANDQTNSPSRKRPHEECDEDRMDHRDDDNGYGQASKRKRSENEHQQDF